WSTTTGEMFVNGVGQGAPGGNTIFMTVWDGGGNDTYDFSNFTASVSADLRPGQWSTTSSAQLANLGSGHIAIGNIANALLFNNNPASLIENVIGGSGDDTLTGSDGNNNFTGGPGNDVIEGGLGSNTAIYSGLKANYTITKNANGTITVADTRAGSPDG